MRELKRTSFERSWNFMKANDKISLVISSGSWILLVLLHTYSYFISSFQLWIFLSFIKFFLKFCISEAMVYTVHVGGLSSQRTFTLFLDEKALRSSEY